ncbi:MAG TPA: FoF1 ATP synthase subunit a [Mycobacteriales bacterium]|jgi:F-type H+-transporting ATPase subunit a|nr:FoF1 ATP synthase subunit a [Mycobacteriales bacterium]HVX71108.1 FoF1 ATP synthase subunit a [Mycobacteriales bacterium]
MEHFLGSGWRWQIAVGGEVLNLDAVLATVIAAGAVIAGTFFAARRAELGRRSQLAALASISLNQFDRAVTAGPQWARRRIAGLAFALCWFVLLAHWMHLIPAITLRAPTSDINVTLALGLLTLAVVNVTAAQVVGVRRYLRHHLRPIYLMPVRVAEIGLKTVTLGLRLFGVLFASAVLIEVVNDLVPPPVAVLPLVLWTAFDIAMAVIQAYIFAILAVTYYNIAVESVGALGSEPAAASREPMVAPSEPAPEAPTGSRPELVTIGGR